MNDSISWTALLESPDVQNLIALSLEEDIGGGDITTESCFPKPKIVEAQIIARTETVACGLPLAQYLFKRLDESVEFISVAILEGATAIILIGIEINGILTDVGG